MCSTETRLHFLGLSFKNWLLKKEMTLKEFCLLRKLENAG